MDKRISKTIYKKILQYDYAFKYRMKTKSVDNNLNNRELSSTEQIKKGAIMSYAGILFNIVIGLAYTPWMIQQIGQSEYALYTLALTIISFFTIDFGLGGAVSRFLSKYNVENDQLKQGVFLGLTFKIYIVLDILLFFILTTVYIFADNIYAELTIHELSKFRVIFIIAALYSLASFPFMPLNGVLIANERFAFIKLADLFNKILTVATMLIVLMLGYKVFTLILVNSVVGILTILIKLRYIYDQNLMKIDFKAYDTSLLKEIFNFSIWTTVIVIAARFVLNITPTVLAAFAGSIQISLFSIAMVLEGYTWTFAHALNGLFLPKVMRLTIKEKSNAEIASLMIKVGRIQLIIVGLLIVGLFSMGKEFIVLWVGHDFLESYYVMTLLIAPCIIVLTQQIGETALVAINEIKYRAFCSIIVAVISFGLSIWFSKLWGAIGAGLAIFVGNIVGLVIGMNIVYYRVLKIDVFRFFKECHIKMATPLIITLLLGVLMQYYFPVDKLVLFILKAFLLSCVYIWLMWTMTLNNYEKSLFREIAHKMQTFL